jgi:hypothetical protein
MDISDYAIHEPLWIDFLENYSNYEKYPLVGDIFEDVSELFSHYFANYKYNIDKSDVSFVLNVKEN